jgi:hypothetical protein
LFDVSHFHPSQAIVGKARAYQSGTLTGLTSNSWLPDLPPNVRLGWKCQTLSNTLAYYDTATINAMKSFIVQAPEARKSLNGT